MTLQHLFESAQIAYPTLGESQFVSVADRAWKAFCSESGHLVGYKDITLTQTTAAYSVPTEVDTVENIQILNAAGKVTEPDFYYTLKDRMVTFVDDEGDALTDLGTDPAKARVSGTLIPTTIAVATTVLEGPTQYHRAILLKVLHEMGTLQRNSDPSWMAEYQNLRHQAKMYGNTRCDRTQVTPRMYPY